MHSTHFPRTWLRDSPVLQRMQGSVTLYYSYSTNNLIYSGMLYQKLRVFGRIQAQDQTRLVRGSLRSLGNALHCNGASYDLVNYGMGSSRVSDLLDCQLAVEFVVLFK